MQWLPHFEKNYSYHLAIHSNLSNMDTEGTERVSVLERCLYKRGHYDDVTFMTPLTVLSFQ